MAASNIGNTIFACAVRQIEFPLVVVVVDVRASDCARAVGGLHGKVSHRDL
jgi:hypothetical protein